MSEDEQIPDKEEAPAKPPRHPLAVGYWTHLATPILLVLVNMAFLVGLLNAVYSIYLHANSISDVTPAKRLDSLQMTAEGGRAELVRSIASLGIDGHFANISKSLQTHRSFYERLLRSDEDFSKLMHLQQNGISHFAAIIGQSDVWQQRYTEGLLALPVHSAKRQFVIRQTIDNLQALTPLAN